MILRFLMLLRVWRRHRRTVERRPYVKLCSIIYQFRIWN